MYIVVMIIEDHVDHDIIRIDRIEYIFEASLSTPPCHPITSLHQS
jgi:hypothetical protein